MMRQLLPARRKMCGFFPQGDTAEEPVQVRHNGDISRHPPDIHLHGVAAADVETVVVKHFFEFANHLEQAIVPQFFADAFELRATQSILTDLEIRHEVAVDEQGRPDPCPQCQDQFHTFSGDRPIPLDIGIVGGSHGLFS